MTTWRRLMTHTERFDDEITYTGPAIYVLALAGPRGGNRRAVYIGETRNLTERMGQYASTGSHLQEPIDWHLRRGWTIYVRYRPMASKAAAVWAERRYLDRYDFDWNVRNNVRRAA